MHTSSLKDSKMNLDVIKMTVSHRFKTQQGPKTHIQPSYLFISATTRPTSIGPTSNQSRLHQLNQDETDAAANRCNLLSDLYRAEENTKERCLKIQQVKKSGWGIR